ncbi:MAG: CopG family transcriptional regulator [Burkholderiales bacterium]
MSSPLAPKPASMRTTLNIDDDVLLAAKAIARRNGKSLGEIISKLARAGLGSKAKRLSRAPKAFFGFRPFPKEGREVGNDLINMLRESSEY